MTPRESRDRADALFRNMESRDRGFDAVEIGSDLPEEYGFVLERTGIDARLRRANQCLLLHVIDFLRRENPSRACLVLKNPWDFGSGPAIKRLLPHAKLLYLHRNPPEAFESLRRMVSSILTEPNPYLALLSIRYRAFTHDPLLRNGARRAVRRFPGLVDRLLLEHMVRESRRYLRGRGSVAGQDVLNVQYEALCRRPVDTLHHILAWLGVDGDCDGLDTMVVQRARTPSEGPFVTSNRALRGLSLCAAASGHDSSVWG